MPTYSDSTPRDYACTLHIFRCRHCGHEGEFLTYIVRTSNNSYNYDINDVYNLEGPVTLFGPVHCISPRCVRCIDRGLPAQWPPYKGGSNTPKPASSGNTRTPGNFSRWGAKTKKTSSSSPPLDFDPLAALKGTPCPSTPDAKPVAISTLPETPPTSPSLTPAVKEPPYIPLPSSPIPAVDTLPSPDIQPPASPTPNATFGVENIKPSSTPHPAKPKINFGTLFKKASS